MKTARKTDRWTLSSWPPLVSTRANLVFQ